MVEIKRGICATITLLLLAVITATGQSGNSFAERQLKQLTTRSERVEQQIVATKALYDVEPNDSLAVVLHELERQAAAIASAVERITIAMATPKPEEPAEPQPTVDTTAQRLAPIFLTSLRRYALTEREIEQHFDQYAIEYAKAAESTAQFEDATNLADATKAGKEYDKAFAQMESIATRIADSSDNLFTSKSNAMIWFADSLDMEDEKAYYLTQNHELESKFTEELRGKCIDLDMAMYPYRKAALMALEVKLARRMCGSEQADSLVALMAKIDPSKALFAPQNSPKRSDAKFGEIVIHKQNKYKSTNDIPRIKVPATGEMYSILVGNYASLPSINSFRKAAPLYSERRADGRTYIYAGLYPTAKSAQQGMETLRKAGFKQPTLVMWHNGLRRDDYVDRTTTTAKLNDMFRVEVRGADYGLSESVREAIKAKAPRKEVSKFTTDAGAIVYTIGIFTKESEAKAIAKTITETDSALRVSVNKIEK